MQEQKVKTATSQYFKQERVYWFTSIPPRIVIILIFMILFFTLN